MAEERREAEAIKEKVAKDEATVAARQEQVDVVADIWCGVCSALDVAYLKVRFKKDGYVPMIESIRIHFCAV